MVYRRRVDQSTAAGVLHFRGQELAPDHVQAPVGCVVNAIRTVVKDHRQRGARQQRRGELHEVRVPVVTRGAGPLKDPNGALRSLAGLPQLQARRLLLRQRAPHRVIVSPLLVMRLGFRLRLRRVLAVLPQVRAHPVHTSPDKGGAHDEGVGHARHAEHLGEVGACNVDIAVQPPNKLVLRLPTLLGGQGLGIGVLHELELVSSAAEVPHHVGPVPLVAPELQASASVVRQEDVAALGSQGLLDVLQVLLDLGHRPLGVVHGPEQQQLCRLGSAGEGEACGEERTPHGGHFRS
mmetsp:Transcript_28528/g.67792  ORF Transcript_28528/g.67792 Transcript_28528/m.67792 type:complete len:293 (-) Transcript_28528:68-946(-)